MNAQKKLSSVGIALALGCLAGASAPVFAQGDTAASASGTTPNDGYYLALGLGFTHRQDAQDRSGPKTVFKGGYVVSGEIGRRFGIARVGLETNYFNNVNKREIVPGVLDETAQGNIGLQTYLLNVYADIPTKNVRLKPYVGVGIGVFQSQVNGLSSATLQSGIPNPAGGFFLNPTVVNVSSNFETAYQFKIGVGYALDPRTEVFVGYRKLEGQRFKLATATLGTLDVRGPNVDTLDVGVRIFLR